MTGSGSGCDGDRRQVAVLHGLALHEVDLAHLGVRPRVVLPGVPAPGLLAVERALRHGDGRGDHGGQVGGQVPARVVGPPALHLHLGRVLLELLELDERLFELGAGADDADQRLHRLLQLLVDVVGVVPVLAPEGGEGVVDHRGDRRRVDARRAGAALREVGRTDAGPAAEDDEVGERVAAQAVGAVHAARHLADGEQARDGGGLRLGVDAHAAHHVVAGRPDLHRPGRDVDAGQLHELVVHGREPAPDVLGRAARRDVEVHAAVRGAAAGLDLGVDGPGHLVAGQQVGRAPVVDVVVVPGVGFLFGLRRLGPEHGGHVVEHEALALGVAQHAAVAAHALGDEDAAHRERPDHAGRVELHALHVDDVGPGPDGHGVAVAHGLPRVRRVLPRLADRAGGEHEGLGGEERPSRRSGACSPRHPRSGPRRRAAGAGSWSP